MSSSRTDTSTRSREDGDTDRGLAPERLVAGLDWAAVTEDLYREHELTQRRVRLLGQAVEQITAHLDRASFATRLAILGGLEITPARRRHSSGLPDALIAVSNCGASLGETDDPTENLQTVMRMKRQLLGPAAQAARRVGLREHSKIIALLQVALPAVRGERLSPEEREAIVCAARVLGQENISREDARKVGALMRAAELDITQLVEQE